MNFLKNLTSFATGGASVGGNLPYEIVAGDRVDKNSSNALDVAEEASMIFTSTAFQVFRGAHKSDSSNHVSVFHYKRSDTEHSSMGALASNAFKRMKSLRHPNLLEYKDGAENPKTGEIWMVTERVQSLDQYLAEIRNSYGNNSKEELQAIQWGFRSIFAGIDFITSDCSLLHGNLSPESIFVTQGGDWKLGGFELVSELTSTGPASHFVAHDHIIDAKFKSPERMRHEWNTVASAPAWSMDIWSAGCVLYYVFNSSGFSSSNDAATGTNNVPKEFKSGYKRIFSNMPNSRIQPAKLLTHAFFKSDFIKTMDFVENLAIKSPEEKAAFYQALPAKLDTFPKAYCVHKILPALRVVVEMGGGSQGPIKLDASASSILPAMLKIGRHLSPESFKTELLPTILRLFACNDRAVRVQLLQMMDQFAQYLDKKTINGPMLDHICTGFADAAPMLRELTVKSILHIAEKLSESNLNTRIIKYFVKMQSDPEPAIRTNTTICLGIVAPHLTEKTRPKVLLPAFMRSMRDPFPHARLAALRAVAACDKYFEANQICTSVLPSICPLLMDPSSMVREEAFVSVNTYVAKLQTVSAEMKVAEEKALEEAKAQEAAKAAAAAENGVQGDNSSSFQAPATSVTSWAVDSVASGVSKLSTRLSSSEEQKSFSKSTFDASSLGDTTAGGSAGAAGWGDEDLDDLGLDSPKVPVPVAAAAKKPPSTKDDFFDDWGGDDDASPAMTPQSSKPAAAVASQSSKKSLQERKDEAKQRREQRKKEKAATISSSNNSAPSGGMKLKKKKDEWDDWDF